VPPTVEVIFQSIKASGPQLAVGRQPVIELSKRFRAYPVEAALCVNPSLYHSRLLEHPQVFGHGGLAQLQMLDKIADRSFSVAQEIDDRMAAGVAQNLERGQCRHPHEYSSPAIYLSRHLPQVSVASGEGDGES
jgi:hypothetical protein